MSMSSIIVCQRNRNKGGGDIFFYFFQKFHQIWNKLGLAPTFCPMDSFSTGGNNLVSICKTSVLNYEFSYLFTGAFYIVQ